MHLPADAEMQYNCSVCFPRSVFNTIKVDFQAPWAVSQKKQMVSRLAGDGETVGIFCGTHIPTAILVATPVFGFETPQPFRAR